jgi:translocation and assembly module TamB
VRIDVDGTRKAHTASLSAQGKDLDLAARARGGWQAGGAWAGTLQQLENRGKFPVLLEVPVAVEAAPGLLRIGALAARVAGGRLDVRQLHYKDGRIASDGRFSELRAAAVLALAGRDPGAGGTLQLSGAWSLTSSPRWNGTVTLRRDSGDIPLGGKDTASIGLETLTVDARVVDDRLEFDGGLRSRLATGQIKGSLLPVETPEGPRMTASSPVKFAASLEVASLAAVAGTADNTLRFDGRVRATVTGAGTLGDPLVTGEVEGDDLSISLPSEGVALRAGILRAELSGREIRVRSFSIIGGEGVFRARGTLARGKEDRAAVEWEAERLRVMGRPDRRLVVTGRGNATLEDGKLSLSGALRADEGLIELRAATLPAPGDDVVILGRPRAPDQAPQLRRAALDLALDFGTNFRIRGRGLDSLLAGKIRIHSGAAGNLLATGSVNTVRGTYMAFGQRLELERGRLMFEGAIENPALDIRAMRKMPAVEAGVEVAGTLQSPFVRVVSEPPMPENDALSWLILGHGPGEATGSDLAMLPAAAAALLGQGESPADGMARKLGVDSIGLRRGGAVGNQFVTVGKRISDDINIVYEQSLGAAANVLKLEFTLSRRLLLRAEAGEISAIGLFYRWAFD